MRILLVEPNYRHSVPKNPSSEETKWYPPLGLMKIARFHVDRGDEVVLALAAMNRNCQRWTYFLQKNCGTGFILQLCLHFTFTRLWIL